MCVSQGDNVTPSEHFPKGGLRVGHVFEVCQSRVPLLADDQVNFLLQLALHIRIEHQEENRPLNGAGDIFQSGTEYVIHYLNTLKSRIKMSVSKTIL